MAKVIVVGAGASGVVTALSASSKNEVILVDGNDRCCKKILLTGNGRCNYWNRFITLDRYITENKKVLFKILTQENIENTYTFLETLGLYPKIKEDYYYPYSNQAASVREIFERQIKKKKITFISDFKVKQIQKEGNQFIVTSILDEQIKGECVILATGSKAYSKTGSDGSGYNLAESLGHKIEPILPSLTSLISKDAITKEWENVRFFASVGLYIDGEKIKEENGEVQFTKNGVSGICIFNLSGLAAKGLYLKKKVEIELDFFSFIEDDLFAFLEKRDNMLMHPSLEEMFESILPYKLLFVLLKRINIKKEKRYIDLTETEKKNLEIIFRHFRISIVDTSDFSKSQVCLGGVSLDDVEPTTLESKKIKGLYFTGEILDVTGDCGGYNLAFSFITGFLVGACLNDSSKTD